MAALTAHYAEIASSCVCDRKVGRRVLVPAPINCPWIAHSGGSSTVLTALPHSSTGDCMEARDTQLRRRAPGPHLRFPVNCYIVTSFALRRTKFSAPAGIHKADRI